MARRLGPVEITLIVIDVLLIGVLVVLLATAPDRPSDPGDDPSGASSPSTSVEPDAPSSTQAVTAPEGALDLAEFTTPSGNIWCTLAEESATCQIADIDYEAPAISGCEDNELAGRVLSVDTEGVVEYPCPTGDIAGAARGDRTVLDYDEVTAAGDFMCASAESGVTCTNLGTGASFSVTRRGPTLSPAG